MASYYCDLTLSLDGAGTSGDPWQWSQAINTLNCGAGDIVNIRGSRTAATTSSVVSQANGASGNLLTYQQWSGESQATFQKYTINGTGDAYFNFSDILFDGGIGTVAVTVFELQHVGGGEVNFPDCTFYGFRSSLFSGGDFYPYYIGASPTYYENIYSISIRYCFGLTLTMEDCTFLHGWRAIRINEIRTSSLLFNRCSFDRIGEDALNIFGADNVTARNCTFGETYPISALYASWFWPGTETGTWTGHEGETITQDNTNDSSIFVGMDGGRIYTIADDINNIPVRTDTNIWRLDSDPTNIYFTPSGAGDNAHNDSLSVEGVCDNLLFEKSYYYSTVDAETGATDYGQAVKFRDPDLTNVIFQNNIIDKWDAGAYAILCESGTSVSIINNIIIAVSNPLHGIRTLAGNFIISNNILSGGEDSGGNITSDYNIYVASSSPWNTESNSLFSQDLSNIPSGNDRYFTDYSNGDFTSYNNNSPNLDIASAIYAPSDDYIGTTRPQGIGDDIGAYERIEITIYDMPILFTV